MRSFERDGDVIWAEFEEFEVALLESLVEQLVEVLGGDEPERRTDPLEELSGGFGSGPELDRSDPLIERLFPDAYPGDAEATADFRRFTESDAVRSRLAEAGVVLDDLAATGDGSERLRLMPDHIEAWIKTLNALRLALSVRLGVVDERSQAALSALSARDPRSHLAHLYDWLGYVLESLLEALTS